MANSNIANPAPLGLAAFGVTTILLSSANAGLWEQSAQAPLSQQLSSTVDSLSSWLECGNSCVAAPLVQQHLAHSEHSG